MRANEKARERASVGLLARSLAQNTEDLQAGPPHPQPRKGLGLWGSEASALPGGSTPSVRRGRVAPRRRRQRWKAQTAMPTAMQAIAAATDTAGTRSRNRLAATTMPTGGRAYSTSYQMDMNPLRSSRWSRQAFCPMLREGGRGYLILTVTASSIGSLNGTVIFSRPFS